MRLGGSGTPQKRTLNLSRHGQRAEIVVPILGMSVLFSPVSFGALRLQNRIIVAPMCQYSAHDGSATDWHMMHLGSLAMSGAGLLIMEATAVEPRGRISPDDLGLWADTNEAAIDRVVRAIRSYSPIPISIQLAHAGRKASTRVPWEGGAQIAPDQDGGWRPVAPSPLPYSPDDRPPEELDESEMRRICDSFSVAARRAERLDLNAIEVHAAHGYLLHQFLSPLSNQRRDKYGGILKNRMRFPLEVFEAVRRSLPLEKPVGVRISATDWVEGGWDLEQSITFARELERRGAAYIHVSSGGLSPKQNIPVGPGYQVPFAQAIKKALRIPVIAVGLITEPAQAERILESGQADAIALARAMLYNPRWPWHAAAALGAQVQAPPQYWRSQPREYKNLFSHELD
jgi:2,4-dienoyl-CoA reductase-like NADH-dependent reductase (Old Yellow Enzyme family)